MFHCLRLPCSKVACSQPLSGRVVFFNAFEIFFFFFCLFEILNHFSLIYFWLYRVFVAICGLSSCSKRGYCSSCNEGFARSGFSSYSSWALESRLSSCGTQVTCSTARMIFLDQGWNVSPALAGGSLLTHAIYSGKSGSQL